MQNTGYLLDRAHPLSRGLVGWWPMIEQAGRRVNDLASGQAGLMANDPAWTGSPLGAGILFNGSNNYINIPHDPRHALAAPFTISAWIKPTSGTSYPPVLCKTNGASNGFSWEFTTSGETALAFWFYSGGWTTKGSIPLQNGIFQHVAITLDGANETRYINGAINSQVANALSPSVSTAALQIGGNTSLSRYFGGVISGVRIYNRALSAFEIANLYGDPMAGELANRSKARLFVKRVSPALRWWYGG